MAASALDFAGSRALTAIAGDRGEADDHGDFLCGQLADLVEAGDEGDGGDGADAGDGSEDLEAPGQDRVGFDPSLDFGLQFGDRRFDGAQLTLQLADQDSRLARADLVEKGGSGGDGALAAVRQFLKAFHGDRKSTR